MIVSFVTVSLDEIRRIHDFNRKREQARGTADVDQVYQSEVRNVSDALRFEGTISKRSARKRKITGFDMQAFARSEYGISGSGNADILTDDREHIDREFLETGEKEKVLGVAGLFYDTSVEFATFGAGSSCV